MPATMKQAEGHPWGYTPRFFEKVIHNCPYQTRGEPRTGTNGHEFLRAELEWNHEILERHEILGFGE